MIIKSNTIIKINGIIALTSLSYLTLAIPCTINKSRPTGGVINPIERLTTKRNSGTDLSLPIIIHEKEAKGTSTYPYLSTVFIYPIPTYSTLLAAC